ncbi:MAG: type II secretion system F family protein [Deltaproteobacteria bacterium]|nr:type II secretion system F family protein [Deltaproteobacteria bacterium]
MIGETASVALGLCLGALVLLLWPDAIPAPPTSGERGERRGRALARLAWFRLAEPLVRTLAARLAALPLGAARTGIEDRLEKAGRPFGFDADELMAAALLSATGLALAGGALASVLGPSAGAGAAVGLALGAIGPWVRLDEAARERRKAICRGLPQAIDLVALAMEAGQDFPGAVAEVGSRMPDVDPLRFELEHLLHKLALGRSRREALEDLAARVPAAPVREFAGAVVQAEQRGTPLAEALEIQARVMRTRRSQAAEQAAARAGVLIIGPLMLIFACVFLILLGPFAVKFMRGELF